MRKPFRHILLFIAALLMSFAAFVNATVTVPHLREDLLEINVRPTLLGAVTLALHFGTFAMFAFAGLILIAAIGSIRGKSGSRLQLGILGAAFSGFGIMAFVLSGSHHTLGYVVMGLLVLIAAIM